MNNWMDEQARTIFATLQNQVLADATGAEFLGLELAEDGSWCVDYIDPSVGLCTCHAQTIEGVPEAIKANALRLFTYRSPVVRPQPRTPSIHYGFSRTVKKRDGKCLKCGATENLHAHHIKPRSTHPHLRKDPANGITLCKQCHGEIKGRELESAEGLTRLLGASI